MRRTYQLAKKLLLLTIGVCSGVVWGMPGDVNACSMAMNVRLFPLGIAKDKLLLLQLTEHRGSSSKKTHWEGRAVLRFSTLKGKLLARTVAVKKFKVNEKKYSLQLRPLFVKAIAKASKYKKFVAFRAPRIGFCQFRKRCLIHKANIQLKASSQGYLELSARKKGKPILAHSATYPPAILTTPNNGLNGAFSKHKAKQKHQWAKGFMIGSYRVYRTKNRSLYVFNLASGGRIVSHAVTQGGKSKWKKAHSATLVRPRWKACKTLRYCVPKEATLWHGIAFDTIVALPHSSKTPSGPRR